MKKICRDMLSMSRPCYIILRAGFLLASLPAAFAILFFLFSPVAADLRQQVHILQELRTCPQVVLLVSAITAVCVEDMVRNQ